MKTILAFTLLLSVALCADPVFEFMPSRTPHYFFQFMEGFELSDNLPQSSKCNSTSSILATDLLRDYNRIYDNYYQRWSKEGIIAFAKTLGEFPDWFKSCKQTLNFVFLNALTYTSQFEDTADYLNSLMEHLTQTVLGIYTRTTSIVQAAKKENMKESEVDQLILDIGKLVRLILDFERSEGTLLNKKDINYDKVVIDRLLARDPTFDEITKMFKSFFGTLIDASIDDTQLKEQIYSCSTTVQAVEAQLELLETNFEQGLEFFKLLHPLAVNCIATYEGFGVKSAKWIENGIPSTNQIITNLLVQMGDISSYLNAAIQDAGKGSNYEKIGENVAKAFLLIFHNVDFKQP